MNQVAKIDTARATPVKPGTFAEDFVRLQAAIRPAIKDANNPAFRSKYADLSAVWEAVRAPLGENHFGIIQAPQYEGETFYLETTLLHISGEKMTSRYPLRPMKLDPQGFGSAITYAKRYAISAMLGVVADEDDDGNAASGKSAPAQNGTPPRAPQDAPIEDQDITDGVKNWCDKQKGVIQTCSRLPDLMMWLDEQGGDWVNPTKPSPIDRLKRKAPEAFEDLKRFYQAKFNFFNKGRAST